MKITVPIRLPSILNCRLHWAVLNRVKKKQTEAVAICLHGRDLPQLPATITLTRVGKRRLDSDNLAASFKACQDQIARTYGVDDGSDSYVWEYRQRIGKDYAVEIEINPRGA